MRRITKVLAVLYLAFGGLAPAQAQMYWRLELGLSQPNDAKLKDKDANFAQIITANFERDELNRIDPSFLMGAGIGYRFSPALRGDLTLSYRGGYQLYDRDKDGGFTPPLPATYHADIASTALLANGYYDFPAGGMRPYVGAGVGLSHNRMGALTQDWNRGFQLTLAPGKRTDAAFALMAGVAIPQPGWTLDLGYRYVDLGKIESGKGLFIGGVMVPDFGFGPYPGVSGRLTAHELTAGIRF
jgi:opacity protein-like surface antigen